MRVTFIPWLGKTKSSGYTRHAKNKTKKPQKTNKQTKQKNKKPNQNKKQNQTKTKTIKQTDDLSLLYDVSMKSVQTSGNILLSFVLSSTPSDSHEDVQHELLTLSLEQVSNWPDLAYIQVGVSTSEHLLSSTYITDTF